MRGLTNFDVGELVTVDGRDLKFDGLVPPLTPRRDAVDDLQFLDARNRRAVTFAPEEFLALYSAGEVCFHRKRLVAGDQTGDDELPSKAITRRWRFFWVTAYDNAPVAKSTKSLAAFVSRNQADQPDPVKPPSPHTLRRWLRERGEEGRRLPRQMGDRMSRHPRRRPVNEFVDDAFAAASERYWTNYRVTFEDVQNEVRSAVARENDRRVVQGVGRLSVPGRTTIWRWLRQDRTYENVMRREGRHAADRQFKAIRNSLSAKRIMDVAILDQKRMDVHLVDSKRQFIIGRPWMAALIDVKSRMILGVSLSFEDPSVLSAMSCIRSALRGQHDLRERFPSIEGEWEAFGVPRTILADNAWENTGSSFVDACADCAISIEWAPIRRPEYKGILERFFSRLDDQFVHKLPGAVVDNPIALANRRIDPRIDACLTLIELEELLYRYIVDVYSTDLHMGIDTAPLKLWRDSVARDGVELAENLSDVEHTMGKLVRDRTLNHEGVKFQRLVYRSPDVDRLLADLLPIQSAGLRPGSANVKIKYHPEDLGKIFVWNEVRNRYVALPCTDQNYARGLSERLHAELRSMAREEGETFFSAEQRCRKKDDFRAEIQNTYDKIPQKERRRRARMLGDGHEADVVVGEPGTKIAVDGVGNRVGGDRPEKSSVRSRKKREAAVAKAPEIALERQEIFDPFASQDRQESIQRSLDRLA